MSRSITDLIPEMQDKFKAFSAKMDENDIEFIVTCTYRSQEQQNALYAQGRTTPGKVVTWTKNSRHTKRDAFDIAILKNGKITWDDMEYMAAGNIGESVGLVWGGRWHNPDYPHFQNS
jgi:peptidoglycan LD-endopeptidase CwlK